MRVGADRLCGHHLVLAKRDQHAPFGDADLVAPRIDAREGLGREACDDVELVRQELLELEHRLGPWRPRQVGPNVAFDRLVTTHGTIRSSTCGIARRHARGGGRSLAALRANMNEVAGPRNGISRRHAAGAADPRYAGGPFWPRGPV